MQRLKLPSQSKVPLLYVIDSLSQRAHQSDKKQIISVVQTSLSHIADVVLSKNVENPKAVVVALEKILIVWQKRKIFSEASLAELSKAIAHRRQTIGKRHRAPSFSKASKKDVTISSTDMNSNRNVRETTSSIMSCDNSGSPRSLKKPRHRCDGVAASGGDQASKQNSIHPTPGDIGAKRKWGSRFASEFEEMWEESSEEEVAEDAMEDDTHNANERTDERALTTASPRSSIGGQRDKTAMLKAALQSVVAWSPSRNVVNFRRNADFARASPFLSPSLPPPPPPTPDHLLMPPPPSPMLSFNDNASPATTDNLGGRRAPPPSPLAYSVKSPYVRPPMPPSPILRQPLSSSPKIRSCLDATPTGTSAQFNPARALYNNDGATSMDALYQPSRALFPTSSSSLSSSSSSSSSSYPAARSTSPRTVPGGNASPASFLARQLNAHHLTQFSHRPSTSRVLRQAATNMTLLKAAEGASVLRRNFGDTTEASGSGRSPA